MGVKTSRNYLLIGVHM